MMKLLLLDWNASQGGAHSPAGLFLVEFVLGIGNDLNMSRESIANGFAVGMIP